jgi:hypothetical protein
MGQGVEPRFPGPICPRSYQPGFFAGATELRPSPADVNFRMPGKNLAIGAASFLAALEGPIWRRLLAPSLEIPVR